MTRHDDSPPRGSPSPLDTLGNLILDLGAREGAVLPVPAIRTGEG